MEIMIGQLLRCVCCRNPQITLLQQWIEGLGHYAQHDVGQSVNARALPDYRGIRMEPCAPQTLADDGDLREPRFIDRKEHTSELQSRGHLVCRLLLEK